MILYKKSHDENQQSTMDKKVLAKLSTFFSVDKLAKSALDLLSNC